MGPSMRNLIWHGRVLVGNGSLRQAPRSLNGIHRGVTTIRARPEFSRMKRERSKAQEWAINLNDS